MDQKDKGNGAASNDAAGSQNTPPAGQAGQGGQASGSDVIQLPKEVYENTKNDMLKYKEEKRALQAQLDEFNRKQEEANKKALEEQQQYKQLYETEKASKSELEQRLKASTISAAVRLEAIKAGIADANDKNLEGLEGITLEADGTVKGASEAIAALKKAKAYLFSTPPKAGVGEGAVGTGQGNNGKPLTYEDLLKNTALAMEMKKNDPAQYEALRKAHFSNLDNR